jgi:hypothetical protein
MLLESLDRAEPGADHLVGLVAAGEHGRSAR